MTFLSLNTIYNTTNYGISMALCGAFGVTSHVIGHLAEGVVIYSMHKLPYYTHYFKVPVAKIAHEIVEGFCNSINPIEFYHNGVDHLQSLKNINNITFAETLEYATGPIINNSGQVAVATLFSWLAEKLAIKAFNLPDHIHLHQHDDVHIVHHHDHHHHHLTKGLFSIAGSFLGTYIYEPLCDLFYSTTTYESQFNDEL